MKKFFHIAVFTLLGLSLFSCGDLNAPLTGGDTMLMEPDFAGGLGTTTAAGLWGHQGHVGYRIGTATTVQKNSAETEGRNLLAKENVKQQLAKKKVRYVAVPVSATPDQKARQKKAAPAMVKIDVQTGKAQGDVFSPESSKSPKSGEEIKLGGDATLYFASTGDKI